MFDMQHAAHQQQQLQLQQMMQHQALHGTASGISVRLCQEGLWEQFHEHLTEMIVTKTGRKLFPKLEISVSGLAPNKQYGIQMRLEQADDQKYRYSSSTWTSNRDEDNACFPPPPPIESNEGYSQLGEYWTQKAVEFSNFKITNNDQENNRGMILVQTLHKYVPVIYIYEQIPGVSYSTPHDRELVHKERLTLAEFVTVTAYQNDAIKRLKVVHNPFAKGCRGHAASASQQQPQVKEEPQATTRRKRSYSPQSSSNDALLGQRSIDGAPASKMASPAFPSMNSMMPSPAYSMPPAPATTTVPTPHNPFPSPPQETRTSPAVHPATVPQFEFPPHFTGMDAMMMNQQMMMMNGFPYGFHFAMPPMEYGFGASMPQQYHMQPVPPYTPQQPCPPPSNQTSPYLTMLPSVGNPMIQPEQSSSPSDESGSEEEDEEATNTMTNL